MKYSTLPYPTSKTISLQSVGHVIGTPAKTLKVGDVTMWNFGITEECIEILGETPSFIKAKFQSESGYIGERRLKKDRLIAILEK